MIAIHASRKATAMIMTTRRLLVMELPLPFQAQRANHRETSDIRSHPAMNDPAQITLQEVAAALTILQSWLIFIYKANAVVRAVERSASVDSERPAPSARGQIHSLFWNKHVRRQFSWQEKRRAENDEFATQSSLHLVPPRIYYVHPFQLKGLEGWRAIFAHAAALGFDTVLTAPPVQAFRPWQRLCYGKL